MKVLRATVTTSAEFDIGVQTSKWLVKNLTSGDITVAFDTTTPEANRIKINAGFGQEIVDNEYLVGEYGIAPGTATHDKIYVWGNGEVEVQAICYAW